MTKITQRDLVPLLVSLVDGASAKGASVHRDVAKMRLREVLDHQNWNTSYVLNNLSSRRCRYIAGLGYPVPSRWMWREFPANMNEKE